jgi:hypothetical protein
MFTKLKDKWGLSTQTFWIVFIAFGLTGTTTAFLTRYVTQWLGMDANSEWYYRLGCSLVYAAVWLSGDFAYLRFSAGPMGFFLEI